MKIINVASLKSSLTELVRFCKNHEEDEIEIVVPDKLSLFMEKFLFEKLNISCSFNLQVSTFNRFAKRSFQVDKTKTISKTGCILLIHKILNRNFDRLLVLKNKAYSFSYAEEIFNTIAQLKASKIGFEEMQKFDSVDSQLMGKIHDLAIVFEEYENEKAGLLDASDQFLMSAFFVGKNLKEKKIVFVGFDDFTAIEYSIIEQVSINSDCYIFNYYNEKNKAIYNSEMFSQLKNIAYINNLPFEVENATNEDDELTKFLNDNLFNISSNKFCDEKNRIRLIGCADIEEEIVLTARRIREQILNGKSYSDFGVAVYNLESNKDKIKEIFEKYEINAYFDCQFQLNQTILFKFLESVFKYNFENYNLSHLIDILNSPFIDIDGQTKKQIIEKLIVADFKGKLKSTFKVDDELQNSLNKVCEFLNLFDFKKESLASEIVGQIVGAMSSLNFLDVLNNLTQIMPAEDKILISKSYEIINNLFDDILRFNKDISIQDFFDIFVHIAPIVKINNLPLGLDCVKLVEADDNMEIFANLFILNCTMQNAPKIKADCGVILDGEIEKLNFSHKLSPTISHINKLSKLRLFNSLLFNENLSISFSGQASEFVTELNKKIVKNIAGAECPIEIESVFNIGIKQTLSKWEYVEKICKFNKINAKNNENLIKNKDFSKISNAENTIYKDLTTISASTLEKYFKCPFNMFLSSAMKIEPRKDNELLSFDVGNILHTILFKYYSNNKNVGDEYEFCKEIVFSYLNKDERLKLNIKSHVVSNLISEAMRVLAGVNYIDQNSNFQTNKNLLEHKFDNETVLKLKNVNIKGAIDRIDECENMMRIVDYKSGASNPTMKELYYGNKLQLFLYSLAAENEFNKKVVGNFYLPLHNEYVSTEENTYMLNGFFLNDEKVVRAFDVRLLPNQKSDIVNLTMSKTGLASKRSNKVLESADLLNMENYAKKVSEQAVEEIKSGYVAPSPNDDAMHCNSCPYAHICMRKTANIKTRNTKTVKNTSFMEEEDERI